ncbi:MULTISPECIES: PEGA domain-containing protein [unclassified Fibrobacter]|uniref:PEGA domain-containing protein n=1 Tax=unclassified Fibrobacter TaxID=2634177 RepID=UPI000D6AF809|nr:MULTISPECIES: PEGA domain-containing protein [unclassified Fibrobacter]PWJ68339.1 PEGA domain-containing protein [Fibrobacter sp. UWR4]PZW68127.1 PEGA domain-containing protein [Fibrobacter sp. UWR1]
MKRLFFLLLAFCIVPQTLWAKYVAILETISEPSAKDKISTEERRYLTDVLRGLAIQSLPAEQNFTIMTRENINVMLPPGKTIEDCEGSCLAETGRNIAADYVSQARITLVSGELAISVEMYETAGNKLISSFNGKGSTINDVEQIIKEQSEEFFKKVKNAGTGWGEFSVDNAFAFQAIQKVIVEITSNPEGALPTVDGKGVPKCTSTPCKVLLEAGEHRFVASKEHYDDTEVTVAITENNQRVSLTLEPIFGYLNVSPSLTDSIGDLKDVTLTVDGSKEKDLAILLDQGPHQVTISHPCYDPAHFNVAIEKGKNQTIEKKLVRGSCGLELNVEKNDVPQEVTVYIDGAPIGKTPFSGTIPLCSQITVGDSTYAEEVKTELKWHEVTKITHSMGEPPQPTPIAIPEPTEVAAETPAEIPTNIPETSLENSKDFHWGLIAASGAVTATGAILAIVGNSNAKSASEKGFKNTAEYKKNLKDAENGQKLRTAGIITAIVGAIGVGLSFAF